MEECTWEMPSDQAMNTKVQVSKLLVLKRAMSDFYIGEMSMKKSYSKDGKDPPTGGIVSKFDLGSRASVDKLVYIIHTMQYIYVL